MTDIKIHNDGKEKYASWVASMELTLHASAEGHYNFDAIGYGSTEEEAVDALKREVATAAAVLAKMDYSSRVRVAWDGTPVEEYDPGPNVYRGGL